MPRKNRKTDKINQKKTAGERIKILFNSADSEALNKNFELANRHVELARKIGMRYNVRMPGEFKRKFCKFCYCYLLPSVTSNVRLNPGEHRIEIKCFKCGKVMFYPYAREIKERRRQNCESKFKE